MAERKSKSGWKYGWPSIIVVSMAVIAAGFTIGVVAGITWQEPGLVFGYLGGQTEGVEWSTASEDSLEDERLAAGAESETPSVAAAPPLGVRNQPAPSGSERAKSQPAADRAPTQKTAPSKQAAPAKPTSGFAIQVGAFSDKGSAEKLAGSLRTAGYAVYLSPTDTQPTSWRVRVGPMKTRPEAEKAARVLETAQKLPTWVLGEGT
jgi:DedD protein